MPQPDSIGAVPHGTWGAPGHTKFIAWRVPEADLRQAYGLAFETIAANLNDEQPLRVLDYDGARVFDTVSMGRLEAPVLSEG